MTSLRPNAAPLPPSWQMGGLLLLERQSTSHEARRRPPLFCPGPRHVCSNDPWRPSLESSQAILRGQLSVSSLTHKPSKICIVWRKLIMPASTVQQCDLRTRYSPSPPGVAKGNYVPSILSLRPPCKAHARRGPRRNLNSHSRSADYLLDTACYR